ncbi:MAG: DUF3105 domain-containing protein [bacterium]|nr:DUF3105 domain-containing protein [bacterium]
MNEEGLSRTERRTLQKQERVEARQKSTRSKLLSRFGLGLALIAALAGAGWFVFSIILTPLPGQKVPEMGREHIAIGTSHTPYNSNPPTSGPHYADTANWGIHETTIPEEYQIHNLEHGGVVVHYKCPESSPTLEPTSTPSASPVSTATPATESATPSADIDQFADVCTLIKNQLESIVRQYQSKVILMPNPKIDKNIALTAWTRIDTFDTLDLDRVKRFIDAYRNRGPENVPDNMPSAQFE